MNNVQKVQNAQDTEYVSINDLDMDCLLHIFSFLGVAERIRLRLVSKCWQEAIGTSLKHLTYFECLHHVSPSCYKEFKCCLFMGIRQLEQVLALCGTSLKHLFLKSESIKADEYFFKLLSKTCPNLEILETFSMEVTKDGLQFAANHYSNLKELQICLDDNFLVDELVQLFENSKRLESLTVHCSGLITDGDMNTKIRFVSIHTILYAMKACPNLHTLHVTGSLFETGNDPILDAIVKNGRQKNFKNLGLPSSRYSRIDALTISKFTELRSLTLNGNKNLNDFVLTTIGNNCKLLSSFTLSGFNSNVVITDNGLSSLSNLQHLKLNAVHCVTGKFFKNMRKLKTVRMSRCLGIDINGLRILFYSAKQLRSLDMDGMINNYDHIIKVLPKNRGNNLPLKIRRIKFGQKLRLLYKKRDISIEW